MQMADDYDFMLPGDRNYKIAKFEKERRAWIAASSQGKARFILFEGSLRLISLLAFFTAFEVYLHPGHLSFALLARLIIPVMIIGPIFNLIAWYWNNRRYLPKPSQESSSGSRAES
jgi:hypothetical protein